ncbi:MAG: AIM24 family protein [Chloroflexi bacterium]|nr:AIM24 family protein [Chloroflexota bacterium]
MQYTIEGELAQIAKLTFNAGETSWGSRGSLMAFDPDIQWTLKVPGGVEGAMRRVFSGEGISLTYIEATRDNQQVTLASNQPGKMINWNLDEEGAVITTRGSFIAAFGKQIDIDVIVARRAGAALFGGAGLFLQKVSGKGTVLVHGSGDFIDYHLKDKESILVSTGNLAAFSETIDYDIQGIGGCRRVVFGGEGLFMTRLTGPGRVLLQSLKRVTAAAKTAAAA